MSTATLNATRNGKITQVIGPVIDVEFPPGELPEIYTALKARLPLVMPFVSPPKCSSTWVITGCVALLWTAPMA